MGDDNNYAIKTTSDDACVNITGGTINGNVGGLYEGCTLIKVSGNPHVGNQKDRGILLSSAIDKKVIAGNLNKAEKDSITLIAPSAT